MQSVLSVCDIIHKTSIWGGNMKQTSEYRNQWIANTYDRINLTVAKGKKALIKEHADECGESVNAFINRAIDEAIARDKTKEYCGTGKQHSVC